MDPILSLEISALSHLRGISDAIGSGDSAVQQSYAGACAFVTGASGFLGKHLVEKLLRSTKIKRIYALIRPKKGRTVEERLAAILDDPLYDSLRKQEPGFADRLQAIAGDIAELKLGISDEDQKVLAAEINYIFHVAATTRFDESLSSATITNVRGTREVIHLARSCKQLRALVHVSTAYSHATYSRIDKPVDEQFYDAPVAPQELIAMVERGDLEKIRHVEQTLMKDWPNTYCFTKAVAEEAVRTTTVGLPVCIVRPSIVICSYREPAPGWLDLGCTYGPGGVMLGIGLGVIHVMLGDRDVKLSICPVDFVNNAIIAAGWSTAGNAVGPIKIYAVCNTKNPTTWGACGDIHRTESRKICTPLAVWYCYCLETASRPLFWLLFTLLHTIPAFFIDTVAILIGKRAQFVKLYSKGYKLFTLFSYFTTHEWKFGDRNLATLYESMNETDKTAYNFNIDTLEWKELMLVWAMGCRKYILKDGLAGTDYAVKKQFWFRIANYILLTLYAYLWYKLFALIFTGVSYLF